MWPPSSRAARPLLQPQVSGPYPDSRPLRRPREGGPGDDGDRSAASDGHGRSRRAPPSGKKRRSTTTTSRRSSGSASSLRPASPAATPTSRRSRPSTTPRRTTSRRSSTRKTQEEQLAYYTIRAPFDGIVGDIPVHVGDFVARQLPPVLTTVDENKNLEAYIYVPTERSGQVKHGPGRGSDG